MLPLLVLLGCSRQADSATLNGYLRAGDANFWLVDTTLVAIGGAQTTGAPSGLGSAIRAEGRRAPDGVFEATRITVGPIDPARAAALAAAAVRGRVEALDPATGRWQVAGRAAQLPPGVAAPRGVAVGDRVAIRGHALPDGGILIAEVTGDRPPPTATPPVSAPQQPPPAATATPTPPQVAPAAPTPTPVNDPTPTPKNGPGEDKDDKDAGGGDKGDKDAGGGDKGDKDAGGGDKEDKDDDGGGRPKR